jgi:hypothetical protein
VIGHFQKNPVAENIQSVAVFQKKMNTTHHERIRNKKSSKLGESALSPDTRLLLKEFMKSSKLNLSQQKYLDEMVRDSACLPASPYPAAPTSSVSAGLASLFQSKKPSKIPFQGKPRVNFLTG